MSGLEALGLACNVMQVISFAIETASLCTAIYNGRPTADGMLKDNAASMIAATSLLSKQVSTSSLQSPEEKELAELAQKCRDASQQLHDQVQSIIVLQQKGSVSKALYVAFKSRLRRSKIEDIQKRLNSYKDTMETHILVSLYQRSDRAQLQQRQALQQMSSDVRFFISRIVAGHTKMEDLLRVREDLTNETQRAEAAVKTHVTNELRNLQIAAVTRPRGEQLLRSLKYSDMNKRFNDITPADETTFTRIFRSYDGVAKEGGHLDLVSTANEDNPDKHEFRGSRNRSNSIGESFSSDFNSDTTEIDVIWLSFVKWLSTNSSLFWIQGKPGSGKSTLVKFLINHEATQALLNQQAPGTIILSHFLWKVGSGMQNNLKGLFCALIHQALTKIPDNTVMDVVFSTFPGTADKDTTSDWSLGELQKVLLAIFEKFSYPMCIFIDGLDEISNQDGPAKLLGAIRLLQNFSTLKVCVSSRAEWLFRERFEAVPTLKLEDLTGPDMRAFVHKELSLFRDEGSVSPSFENVLVCKFVSKAQGVFLWLSLALNSVKSGMEKKDCEEELSSRLEGLPSELEDLYADMWRRLNQDDLVYRSRAALYLKLAIARNGDEVVSLDRAFILMAAAEPKVQAALLNGKMEVDVNQLEYFCDKAQREISTRCVGLLEFVGDELPYESEPSNLAFALNYTIELTHRTVHDFLTDTEPGQRILSYDQSALTSPDLTIQLIKGILSYSRVLSWRHGGQGSSKYFPWSPMWLLSELASVSFPKSSRDDYTRKSLDVLGDIERFLDKKILVYDNRPAWYPPPPFLALVARVASNNEILEDYVTTALIRAGSSAATEVLREMWFDLEITLDCLPSAGFIERLMELGAVTDSHNVCLSEPTTRASRTTATGNAMTRFLIWACRILVKEIRSQEVGKNLSTNKWGPSMVTMATALAKTYRSLDDRTLCYFDSLRHWLTMDQMNWALDKGESIIIAEVNLAFLLCFLLDRLTSKDVTDPAPLPGFRERIPSSFVSIRYVIYNSNSYLNNDSRVYRPRNPDEAKELVIPKTFPVLGKQKDAEAMIEDRAIKIDDLIEGMDCLGETLGPILSALAKEGIGMSLP